jgi:hypothetical protein
MLVTEIMCEWRWRRTMRNDAHEHHDPPEPPRTGSPSTPERMIRDLSTTMGGGGLWGLLSAWGHVPEWVAVTGNALVLGWTVVIGYRVWRARRARKAATTVAGGVDRHDVQ